MGLGVGGRRHTGVSGKGRHKHQREREQERMGRWGFWKREEWILMVGIAGGGIRGMEKRMRG